MKYALIILLVLIIYYNYRKNRLLICDGNIIFKNLTESYDLESLMHDLIKKNIDDISKIEKAYLIFGILKIVQNKPYILISNGKIDYNALLKTKKNVKYINEILKRKSLKINQVLYAIYINDNLYIVKN